MSIREFWDKAKHKYLFLAILLIIGGFVLLIPIIVLTEKLYALPLYGGIVLALFFLLFVIDLIRVRILTKNDNGTAYKPYFTTLRHRRRNKDRNYDHYTEIDYPEDLSKRFYNRFGARQDELSLSTERFSVSSEGEIWSIKLDSLIFNEEVLDETCGICKLQFNTGQIVVYCPNCENLFHKPHIEDWLKKKPYCPICTYSFKKLRS